MKILSIKLNLLPQVYVIFFLLLNYPQAAEEDKMINLLIYNAASTSNLIEEISNEWKKNSYSKIRSSSAGSSALAKQIINGAPANIYISASWLWVKELRKNNLIIPETIKPIFENRLVLIANKKSNIDNIGLISNKKDLENIFDQHLINRRISIADPTHVPAGIYSKQALLKLGLWNKLNRKNMAWGADVRRTLKFVALGNSPIGIVYYTDALAEPNVKIIGNFDNTLHEPIQYWVVGIKKNFTKEVHEFLSFLDNDISKKIYLSHGFRNIEGK